MPTDEPAKKPLIPKFISRNIVKLAVWSLVIGLALSFLNIHPRDVIKSLGSYAQGAVDWALSAFEWALGYIILGAVVVVPIWLLAVGWRKLRGKN